MSRFGFSLLPKLWAFMLMAVAPGFTVTMPDPPTVPPYHPPPLISRVPPLTTIPPLWVPATEKRRVPGPVLVSTGVPESAPLTSRVRPAPTDHSCAAERATADETVRFATAGSISMPPERVSASLAMDTAPAGSSTTRRETVRLPLSEVARLDSELPLKTMASFESGTAEGVQFAAADHKEPVEPFQTLMSLPLSGTSERVMVAGSDSSVPSFATKVKLSMPDAPGSGV